MQEIFPLDWLSKPEAEKIDLLKTSAKELIEAGVSVADALPQLRERAELIHSSCRNQELTQFLRNVKSKKVSLADLVKAGDKLSLKPQPFLLDSVFVPNGTNLVIGREKKGKTAFVVGWLEAWYFNCQQFCGFDLVGDCPPVVIIGPDMSEEQWGAMLHMYHLADEEGQLLPDGPIKLLLHMGHGLTLDQHGLDLIDQAAESICAQYPDQTPLFIFDAYARLVDGLGLQEATSEIAGPMAAAQAVLRRHKVTDVWLHHSAANRDSGKATSRGSTALPALADQQVFLEYPSANEDDTRTLLRTKGRSIPARALIERTKPDGVWMVHANGDEVEAQQRIQQRIDRIRGGTGSEKCFQAMQALHSANPFGVDLWQVAEAMDVENEDHVRKPMRRLIELSLVDCRTPSNKTETGGRPREKYQILASVRKVLGLDSTVQKVPSTLGNKEIRANRSESPDANGSQDSLAHMESFKTFQKGMQDEVSDLSALFPCAGDQPALNGSKDAVHAFIQANPDPHHSALANQIKAQFDVDISGAGVKAIREQLAAADFPL